MAIYVDSVNSENKEKFQEIVSIVYDGGNPPDFSKPLPNCDHYLAFHDSKQACIYRRLAFDTLIEKSTLPTSGIALVGVLPEFRSSGVGKSLLGHAVRTAFKEKKALIALYPFSERYYRQFGFASSRPMVQVTCPVELMPKIRADLHPRPILHSNINEIQSCYEKFASRRSGFTNRNQFLWDRKILDHPHFLIFGFGDPMEAYITVDLKPGFHDKLEINEVIWLTPKGYQSAIAFLPQLAINKSELQWIEPENSPFLRQYATNTNRMTVTSSCGKFPIPMFRAANIETLFHNMPKPNGTEGELVIEIADSLVPENRGPWRLELKKNHFQLEKVQESKIVIDTGTLAQLALGAISSNTWIEESFPALDERTKISFKEFFPSRDVGCYDFY